MTDAGHCSRRLTQDLLYCVCQACQACQAFWVSEHENRESIHENVSRVRTRELVLDGSLLRWVRGGLQQTCSGGI